MAFVVVAPVLMTLGAPGTEATHISRTQPSVVFYDVDVPLKYGGRTMAVAIHPDRPDEAIAATDSGGLFITSNGGDRWSPLATEVPVGDARMPHRTTDVAYDPDDPSRIIATTRANSEYVEVGPRTTTRGGIWLATNGPDFGWEKPTDADPPAPCGRTASAWAISFLPGTDDVYIGTDCGLAVSDDRGHSWTHVDVDGIGGLAVYSLVAHDGVVDVCTTQGHFRLDVASGGWSGGGTGSCRARWTNAIAASPVDPDTIFLVSEWQGNNDCGKDEWRREIYQSSNAGATWTTLRGKDCSSNRPSFVAAPPVGDDGRYTLYYGNGIDTWRVGGCGPQGPTDDGPGCLGRKWSGTLPVGHLDPTGVFYPAGSTCPLFMGDDGGVERTENCGASWSLVGTAENGFNALQLYRVVGQIYRDHVDLYIGSQDNSLWASPDGGVTWPNEMRGEVGAFQMPRYVEDHGPQIVTGVICGPCRNFVADAHLEDPRGWNDPDDPLDPDDKADDNAPFLIAPDTYVQWANGSTGRVWITTDGGDRWTLAVDLPWTPSGGTIRSSGPAGDPVLYIPIKTTDSSGKSSKIGLVRVTGFLPGDEAAAFKRIDIDSSGNDVLNLTRHPRQFEWPRMFAVSPHDPDHLYAVDHRSRDLKVTRDGGTTWNVDETATRVVTDDADLRMIYPGARLCCSQISTIAFHPDDPDWILLGTENNGIVASPDGGDNWWNVPRSFQIPAITSVFFDRDDAAWLTSWGRGLWRMEFGDALVEDDDAIEHQPDLEPDRFDRAGGNNDMDHATSHWALGGWRHVHGLSKDTGLYDWPDDPLGWSGTERWHIDADGLTLTTKDDVDWFHLDLPESDGPPPYGDQTFGTVHPDAPECASVELPGKRVIQGNEPGLVIEYDGATRITEGYFHARMSDIPVRNGERLHVKVERVMTPTAVELETVEGAWNAIRIPCPRGNGIDEIWATVGDLPEDVEFPARTWWADYDLDFDYVVESTLVPHRDEEPNQWFVEKWQEKEAHLAHAICTGFPRCDLERPLDFGHVPMPGDERECWADGPGCPMHYGFNWDGTGTFDMVLLPEGLGSLPMFDGGGGLAGGGDAPGGPGAPIENLLNDDGVHVELRLLDGDGQPVADDNDVDVQLEDLEQFLPDNRQLSFGADDGFGMAASGAARSAGTAVLDQQMASSDDDLATTGGPVEGATLTGRRLMVSDLPAGFYVLEIAGPHDAFSMALGPPPDASDRDLDGVLDHLDPEVSKAKTTGKPPLFNTAFGVTAVGVIAAVAGALSGFVIGRRR